MLDATLANLGFADGHVVPDGGHATLNSVFNAFFFDVGFRNVKPKDYRLFQAADLFCTLELPRAKVEDNASSRSDLYFFQSKQALQEDYLRKILKKRFGVRSYPAH